MKKKEYILHIPHSGIKIPQKYLKDYLISSKDLNEQIINYADLYTEELYGKITEKKNQIIFPYSRMFVDVERFFKDNEEEMYKKYKLGWFYENQIYKEEKLRNIKHKKEIEKYYIEHHEKLTETTEKHLKRNSEAIIIDCHSFPNQRYWFHDKKIELPEICIGYEEFHKDKKLIKKIKEIFKDFQIKENIPYKGSYVPTKYWNKEKRVKSVMIEINKKIYLEEDNITKNQYFEEIQNKLKQIKTI